MMSGMIVTFWNITFCLFLKSVICLSKYSRIYGLCWLLLEIYLELTVSALFVGPGSFLSLCLWPLVLLNQKFSNIYIFDNEHKLEYIKLER